MSSSQSTQKRCAKCGEIKSLEDYAKRTDSPDGRRAECKACRAEYARMKYAEDPEGSRRKKQAQRAADPEREREQGRARRKANLEKFRAQKRAWKAAHPDKVSEYNRKYRSTHLEEVKLLQRNWYNTNLGRVAVQQKAYRQANPHIGLAKTHRRMARISGNGGSCTAAELNDLKLKQNHQCAYCQRLAPLQVEHIIPVSRGGSSDKSNLCWACRKCNLNKGRKTPDEWVNRWYLSGN